MTLFVSGGVAQLVERNVRNVEARGSTPLTSRLLKRGTHNLRVPPVAMHGVLLLLLGISLLLSGCETVEVIRSGELWGGGSKSNYNVHVPNRY
jgi:hypothetical protein